MLKQVAEGVLIHQDEFLVAGDMLSDVLIPGHGSDCGPDQVRLRIEQGRANVHAVRDGQDADDPRVGPSAKPGWEWVASVHEWQRKQIEATHAG